MSERLDSILKLCPELFTYKRILYVGARPDRFDFLMSGGISEPEDGFLDHGCIIDILEVFPDNARHFKELNKFNDVIVGDIRHFSTDPKKYDVIFWWHGPEHIPSEDIEPTLVNLEKYTNIVILGCPWGSTSQDAIHDNPYERHVSSNYEETFKELGYSVDTIGNKDQYGSNLTAVKYVD